MIGERESSKNYLRGIWVIVDDSLISFREMVA